MTGWGAWKATYWSPRDVSTVRSGSFSRKPRTKSWTDGITGGLIFLHWEFIENHINSKPEILLNKWSAEPCTLRELILAGTNFDEQQKSWKFLILARTYFGEWWISLIFAGTDFGEWQRKSVLFCLVLSNFGGNLFWQVSKIFNFGRN